MTTKACVSVWSQTEIGFCGAMFSLQKGMFTTVTQAVCPLMEGHCVTALPLEQIDWAAARVFWGLESISIWSKQMKSVGSGCCFSWEAQALGWSLKSNPFSPPDYKRKWKRKKNTISLKYIKYIFKECPKHLLMCWKIFIVTVLGLSGILKGHSLVWGDGLTGGIALSREI